MGNKSFKIVRGADGNDLSVDLSAAEARAQVLSDDEVREIVELAMATERHNGCPQDTEWAIAGGKAWLVQARPITTLHRAKMTAPESHDVLARGLPAVPGEASGTVRVLLTPAEGGKLLDGEVLVAQMTNPDWLPTMRRASALVTDTGGMTCHAAIVARELGVPCIVGARTATTDLKDGWSSRWTAPTAGCSLAGSESRGGPRPHPSPAQSPQLRLEVTATKIYVNLAMPDKRRAGRRLDVDGVGLLRAEFILTDALRNRHPRDLHRPGRAGRAWWTRWPPRSGGSPRHSRRGRWSIGRPTSAPTSSADLEGGRGVRTRRAQPDDRLSRLLPLRQASPTCSRWSCARWRGCASRTPTCT